MSRTCAITSSVGVGRHYGFDFLNHNYVTFFSGLGFEVVILPNSGADPGDLISATPLSLLVFSGGNDLSIEMASGRPTTGQDPVHRRDSWESRLYAAAVDKGVPVLGICRGMQFLNAAHGGGVTQPLSPAMVERHVAKTHEVEIVESTLAPVFGQRCVSVNSYHRHGVGIDQLSGELTAVALAEEGRLVEALRVPGEKVVGVQWHPEREQVVQATDRRLVEWVTAAG